MATLKKLIEYWPVGSYLVMRIIPRVTVGITLLDIGYKYNYRKVLGFIDTKRDGSNEPDNPYLSRFPEISSNVSVIPAVHPHLLLRYFDACNSIENDNRMQQYGLNLEKYWLTQSGYFRLANTVGLGMGIAYGTLLYCHAVSEVHVDRKI